MGSLRERLGHAAPETQGVPPSWGPRTHFGRSRQLCERRLQEEGGHDEVDLRNMDVVGQKAGQDAEPREQAGALLRLGGLALQVI